MRKLALVCMMLALPFFLGACFSRIPLAVAMNETKVRLTPEDIVIKGPTQGSSSSFVLLGLQFGLNSFLEAEQAALEAINCEMLLDRYRYIGRGGFVIGNFVVIGSHTYFVEGTGIQIVE